MGERQVGGLGCQLVLLRRRVTQREQRVVTVLGLVLRLGELRVGVRRDFRRPLPQLRLLLLELGDLLVLAADLLVLALGGGAGLLLLALLVRHHVGVAGAR